MRNPENGEGPGESDAETAFVRVTPMGRFYFDDLFKRLTYAQEIKVATYLTLLYYETVNESVLAPPKSRVDTMHLIQQRIAETDLFVDFIAEMEVLELQKARSTSRSESLLSGLTSPSALMREAHALEKRRFL